MAVLSPCRGDHDGALAPRPAVRLPPRLSSMQIRYYRSMGTLSNSFLSTFGREARELKRDARAHALNSPPGTNLSRPVVFFFFLFFCPQCAQHLQLESPEMARAYSYKWKR